MIRGLIDFEDTITEQQALLVEEGIKFQAGVEATAIPLTVKPAELRRLFAQESIHLFGAPVLKNQKLKIKGKPDAIETAKGALLPVEVKSHKDIQRSDELELAFHWMLLVPCN